MPILDRDVEAALPTQPLQLGNMEPDNWDLLNVNTASYSSAHSVLIRSTEFMCFVADSDDVQGPKCYPSMSSVIRKQGVQVHYKI